MASKTKEIFDAILKMEPGQKMMIPAASKQHRESQRIGLYKERAKWQESYNSEIDIIISQVTYSHRITGEPVYLTSVEIVKAPNVPFILDKDDNFISTVKVGSNEVAECIPENIETTVLSEEERMRELMKKDGQSQEEIDDYFKEEKEDD